jgi:alpha-glucosidase (family GH31 glycosyl hydrolase)
VHNNIYGHNWAKLVQEGYRADFPEQLVYSYEAGYSGSQRFGMIPWSGDVSRVGGGRKRKLKCTSSRWGMGYIHSDLGGLQEQIQIMNYTFLWLQYSVFQLCRPHAQEITLRTSFKEEKTSVGKKKAIELRYQMIPYITSFFENNQKTPLMRPLLFFEEPTKYELYRK